MMQIRTREDFGRVLQVVARVVPWRMPLYAAAADGLIQLVELTPQAALPKMLDRSTKPLVILIGDDGEMPAGPHGWRCTPRLRRMARGAIIHAAGGTRDHYQQAVQAAIAGSAPLALIETTTDHAEAWGQVFSRRPKMLIVPRPGDRHPRATAPATVN